MISLPEKELSQLVPAGVQVRYDLEDLLVSKKDSPDCGGIPFVQTIGDNLQIVHQSTRRDPTR